MTVRRMRLQGPEGESRSSGSRGDRETRAFPLGTRRQFLRWGAVSLSWLIGLGTLAREAVTGDSSARADEAAHLRGTSGVGSVQVVPDAVSSLFYSVNAAAYESSSKMYFAQYFTQDPVSIDDKAVSTTAPYGGDYYADGYLALHGESNAHETYGGFYRNRPIPRAPRGTDFAVLDAQDEVNWAKSRGIDGFIVDLLSGTPGSAGGFNWDRAIRILDQANELYPDGSFKIIPEPDCTAGFVTDQTITQISDELAMFLTEPSAWKLSDGRVVVSAYVAEAQDPSWWDELFSDLQDRYSLDIAFMPIFLSYSDATVASFSGYSWSFGAGNFGDAADPAIATAVASSKLSIAHNHSLKYVQPILAGNVRPKSHFFDENVGTNALANWWANAITTGADFVHHPTWNDYSEQSEGGLQPSVAGDWVALDLGFYYAYKWKTGSAPTIETDAIVVSHRSHLLDATYQSSADGQTTFMSQRDVGSSKTPAGDYVTVRTFLTSSSSVSVSVGGTEHSYTAPAGEHVETFTNGIGSISASVSRGGETVASVTSPIGVSSTPYKDEIIYYHVASWNDLSTMYNPNLV